jgi:hypothetical protein
MVVLCLCHAGSSVGVRVVHVIEVQTSDRQYTLFSLREWPRTGHVKTVLCESM